MLYFFVIQTEFFKKTFRLIADFSGTRISIYRCKLKEIFRKIDIHSKRAMPNTKFVKGDIESRYTYPCNLKFRKCTLQMKITCFK